MFGRKNDNIEFEMYQLKNRVVLLEEEVQALRKRALLEDKDMEFSKKKIEFRKRMEKEFILLGEESYCKFVEDGYVFVCALKSEDDYLMIILKSHQWEGINSLINLRTVTPYDGGEQYIEMIDFLSMYDVINQNKDGKENASILLDYLIRDVRNNTSIRKITSHIYDVDKKYFDIIESFYKRYNFAISWNYNNDGTKNSANLILNI